ncbi:MAG: hypothetical protein KC561_20765 [Myxococcales bacterium]|nr:hypothetical protein [Myxococcales bacterium]
MKSLILGALCSLALLPSAYAEGFEYQDQRDTVDNELVAFEHGRDRASCRSCSEEVWQHVREDDVVYQLPAGRTNLRTVPRDVTVLLAAGTDLDSIRHAPPGLRVLDVSGTAVSSVRYLPSGLEVFLASDTQVSSIRYLPGSLKWLDISRSRVSSLRYLPEGLEYLDASDTDVESVRYLPSALKHLRIRNTEVNSLCYLPSGLETLDASGSTDRTSCVASSVIILGANRGGYVEQCH